MLRTKWLAVGFLTLLISSPVFAAAEGESIFSSSSDSENSYSVKVTDHSIFSNAKENGNPHLPSNNLILHEDTIHGETGNYSASVNFTNSYTPDGDKKLNLPFNLEKKTLSYENDNWKIDLGDSHQELGRGIALSLYQDPTWGIDNTLEGGSARYQKGAVEAFAFGGRVNSLAAPVAINPYPNIIPNINLWLASSGVKVDVGDEAKVGAYYLLSMEQPQATGKVDERWHTVGANFEKDDIFGDVDVYFESNMLTTEYLDQSETTPEGYGSYGSITWSPASWKVKLEGKDYRNYIYPFQQPPTMEEDIILENNFQNVSASRLSVEKRLDEKGNTVVYGSYLVGYDGQIAAPIDHPVVGVKFPMLGAQMEVKGGYRWSYGNQDLIHGTVKAKVHTTKTQSIEAEYDKQFWNLALNTPNPRTLERNIFLLSYIFSEHWGAQFGYEYSPTNDASLGKNFFNVGGTYTKGKLATRAFVGQTNGGTECAGGICRYVPPYSGAMLETTYAF